MPWEIRINKLLYNFVTTFTRIPTDRRWRRKVQSKSNWMSLWNTMKNEELWHLWKSWEIKRKFAEPFVSCQVKKRTRVSQLTGPIPFHLFITSVRSWIFYRQYQIWKLLRNLKFVSRLLRPIKKCLLLFPQIFFR